MAVVDLFCCRSGSRNCKSQGARTSEPKALTHSVLQLCVSVPAIRPLLAIYFPRLLESSRRPARQIKEWYDDSNELSNKTPSSGKTAASKESSGYFSESQSQGTRDIETGSADRILVGDKTHPMEYVEVSKPER